MKFSEILSGARFKLFLFVLIVALPVLGFFLFNQTLQSISDNVNNEISQTTRVIAYEQESWILRTAQLLETISRVPEVSGGDKEKCSKFLADILPIHYQYINFGVVDTAGDIICSAAPYQDKFNFKDNLWFQRVMATRSFAIGEFQVGQVVKKPTIVFGSPVFDDQGNLKYIIAAGLDLRWLEGLSRETALPEDAVTLIIDRQGIILSQIPDGEKLVGQKIPEADLLETVLTQKNGTAELTGHDGIKRIYAFTSLYGLNGDMFSIVGIPFHSVYNQAVKIALPYIIVLISTILAFLGLIWLSRK